MAFALSEVRRFDEAITPFQNAAAIYRESGDRDDEGAALNNLGVALRKVRRFDEAITACQDAAASWRETGNKDGEVMALHNLKRARQRRKGTRSDAHTRRVVTQANGCSSKVWNPG